MNFPVVLLRSILNTVKNCKRLALQNSQRAFGTVGSRSGP